MNYLPEYIYLYWYELDYEIQHTAVGAAAFCTAMHSSVKHRKAQIIAISGQWSIGKMLLGKQMYTCILYYHDNYSSSEILFQF